MTSRSVEITDRLQPCWRACGRFVPVTGSATCAECIAADLPPGCCTECGGHGEWIFGDGGGGIGKPHDTGYTLECDRCGGSGWAYVHGGPA